MTILYDGIGADPSRVHTEERFLEIMKRDIENKKWQKLSDENFAMWFFENEFQLKFKDWVLPDDFCFFTLEDWIEYAGGVRVLEPVNS